MLAVSLVISTAGRAHARGDLTPPHVVEVIHRADSVDVVIDAAIGPTTAVVVSSPLEPNRFAPARLDDSGYQIARIDLSVAERHALGAGEPLRLSIQPLTFDAHGSTSAGMSRAFILSNRDHVDGLRPDRMLFGFLGLALFGVLWLFRREPDLEHRLRLAGAAGLISVLFLCTTPAMSWTETPPDSETPAMCTLGDEARCAADAGAQILEHADWAAAAIRAGHMTIILLLLPACIWLMVSPRNRGAQALLIGGAAPALFTSLATIYYAWAVAPWSSGSGGAADLTLLASASLLAVAAVAGLVGRRLRAQQPIPTAVVRQRVI